MKKVLLTFGIAASIITGLQSCKGNSEETKQTSEAKGAAEKTENAEDYVVDAAGSKIKWVGKTVIGKEHFGAISFKSGDLSVEEGKLVSGSFSADMNTIKSEDLKDDAEMAGKLDGHLKAEEIFDVVKYPEAKFTITSVKPLEGEFNTELEGNLEIKGEKKNLSVKANVKVDGDKLTLQTEKFTINRQDFKVTYSNGNPKDKLIHDEFDMEVTLEANKK